MADEGGDDGDRRAVIQSRRRDGATTSEDDDDEENNGAADKRRRKKKNKRRTPTTKGEEADGPTDSPSSSPRVTDWDILALVVSILSHIIDVAFDINLAYRYYKHSKMVYFALTMVFILFPAFVNTFISVRMYVLSEDTTASSRMALKKWAIRVFVLLFQLAPIMRYCDSLEYALKSRRAEKRRDQIDQKRYYEMMLKEDSDVALLRVFECFLEAAPQQSLQVAIVLIDRGRGSTYQLLHQFGSIVSSLLSMAWSMASYHRSIRFSQHNKINLTWSGTAMQFLWHFCVTVSRILAISSAASVYPVYTGAACAVHSAAMTAWLTALHPSAGGWREAASAARRAKERAAEWAFCTVLGLVYIFTYLTPTQGHTSKRYLVYYPICFVENVAALTAWAVTADRQLKAAWYFLPFLVSGITAFLVGIVFMLLYYRFFHPVTSQHGTSSRVRVSPSDESPPKACTAETQTEAQAEPPDDCACDLNMLSSGEPDKRMLRM